MRCKHGFLPGQCDVCGGTSSGNETFYDQNTGRVVALTLKATNKTQKVQKNKKNQENKCDKIDDKTPVKPVRNIKKIPKEIKEISQKKESVVMDKKGCCVPKCPDKAKARGLCDRHWYQWRKGKIIHPETGEEWKPSAQYIEQLKIKEKKKAATKDRSINPNLITDGGITSNTLFFEMRKRLREVEHFITVLSIIGQKEQVMKEINLFSQKYSED